MLLREDRRSANLIGIGLALVVGALAGSLVLAGNPGNMGICGACFLRDVAGALGLISKPSQLAEPKLSYLRPEVLGVTFGALAAALAGGRFVARSGGHAASRFVLGIWMSIGALVFLGCPFRMLQRIGGGDGNALVGLGGFVAGVFAATGFERAGYSIGKTAPAPAPVGLQGHVMLLVAGAAFVAGGVLAGPGPGAVGVPPHAFWLTSLGVAALAGAIMSITGFCAVSAARSIFRPPRAMAVAALALIAGYAAAVALGGRFHASFANQPVAHADGLWNFAAMVLVGLTGALAGGCPVRQMVMAGEGNADALMAVAGLLVGGALAHDLGLASSAAGPTAGGRIAVIAGVAFAAAYAATMTRAARTSR
jgi:YedE family putative selenium metabolism protein